VHWQSIGTGGYAVAPGAQDRSSDTRGKSSQAPAAGEFGVPERRDPYCRISITSRLDVACRLMHGRLPLMIALPVEFAESCLAREFDPGPISFSLVLGLPSWEEEPIDQSSFPDIDVAAG
jgi:hypothetical protein